MSAARFTPTVTGGVTLSDLDSTQAVVFGFSYPGVYTVTFGTVEAVLGEPAAGAFTPSAESKTSSGFDVTVAAAPGVGASVFIPYLVIGSHDVSTGAW